MLQIPHHLQNKYTSSIITHTWKIFPDPFSCLLRYSYAPQTVKSTENSTQNLDRPVYTNNVHITRGRMGVMTSSPVGSTRSANVRHPSTEVIHCRDQCLLHNVYSNALIDPISNSNSFQAISTHILLHIFSGIHFLLAFISDFSVLLRSKWRQKALFRSQTTVSFVFFPRSLKYIIKKPTCVDMAAIPIGFMHI